MVCRQCFTPRLAWLAHAAFSRRVRSIRRWRLPRTARGAGVGWQYGVCCGAIRYAGEDLIQCQAPVTTALAIERILESLTESVMGL